MDLCRMISSITRAHRTSSSSFLRTSQQHPFRLFSVSSSGSHHESEPPRWWRSDYESAQNAQDASAEPKAPKTIWWHPESESSAEIGKGSKPQCAGESPHSRPKWWRRMNNPAVPEEESEEAAKSNDKWWHPGSKSPADSVKETKPQTLAELRKQYAAEVSVLRKRYFAELEEQRMEQAREDAVRWRKVQEAKEERLKQKKKRSEVRGLEVVEEKRVFQEQLAKERAEKFAHRQAKESQLEAKRQKERDIVRQESAHWIEEKDLELKIIEALVNPVEL